MWRCQCAGCAAAWKPTVSKPVGVDMVAEQQQEEAAVASQSA
jgi:hypothetical protein